VCFVKLSAPHFKNAKEWKEICERKENAIKEKNALRKY